MWTRSALLNVLIPPFLTCLVRVHSDYNIDDRRKCVLCCVMSFGPHHIHYYNLYLTRKTSLRLENLFYRCVLAKIGRSQKYIHSLVWINKKQKTETFTVLKLLQIINSSFRWWIMHLKCSTDTTFCSFSQRIPIKRGCVKSFLSN